MRLYETSFEEDGVVYFKRTWECHGQRWHRMFRYDDLEAAAYTPVCEICEDFDGSLFV